MSNDSNEPNDLLRSLGSNTRALEPLQDALSRGRDIAAQIGSRDAQDVHYQFDVTGITARFHVVGMHVRDALNTCFELAVHASTSRDGAPAVTELLGKDCRFTMERQSQ